MFGYSSWNDFVNDASAKITQASEVVSEKVNSGLEVVKEKAVEYELDKKAESLRTNISEGVTSGYVSVQKFVEETAKSIEHGNEDMERVERKREAKRKALEMNVYPWSVVETERHSLEELKDRILEISSRDDVFTTTAPENFEFNLRKMLPFAYGILKIDANIGEQRLQCVPEKMKEKHFWRNYFYRVSLTRKQVGVSPLSADSIDLYKTVHKNEVVVESLDEDEFAHTSDSNVDKSPSKTEDNTKLKDDSEESGVLVKFAATTLDSDSTKEEPSKAEEDSEELDLDELENMLGDVESDDDEIDDAELQDLLNDENEI